MQPKFLELKKSCQEKWEHMKPNKTGGFCDLCSKNVVDFTKLKPYEISEILKKSNGNICARMTQSQLEMPLWDINQNQKATKSSPHLTIAMGLLLATTLSVGQPLPIQNSSVKTEFLANQDSTKTAKKNISLKKQNPVDSVKTSLLEGKVISEESGQPIKNAKVDFLTIQKTITSYTDENGNFSLKIPNSFLQEVNSISFSFPGYEEIKYKRRNFIFTREEISKKPIIQIESYIPRQIVLGHVTWSKSKETVVLYNNEVISYDSFNQKIESGEIDLSKISLEAYNLEPISAEIILNKKFDEDIHLLKVTKK